MSAAAGPAAAVPTHDNITCFMLFMVHGSVTLHENTSAPLRLPVSAQALNLIGTDIDIDIDIENLEISQFLARVVCLVSPSNMGYSVMNSSNSQFPTYVKAFQQMVQADPTMNENKVSALLNFYDTRLYSFFGDHIQRERFNIESRIRARASDLKELDMRDILLTLNSNKMEQQEFIARMQTIRDAIGLDWKPHYDYYIGNKLYCPGRDANQCCLYFPKRIEPAVCDNLRSNWSAFKGSSTELGFKKLAEYLNLHFSEDVLTIEFHYNTNGVVKNTLWEGITLERFFQQVTILLMKVFAGVEGFDVNQLMSRTCVVDTACSDFCVKQGEVLNEVSIISFEENPIGSRGGITASVSIRRPTDLSHFGFWGYLIRKNEMIAAGKELRDQGKELGFEDRTKPHVVVKIDIPIKLKEFVPCLTSLEATIKKVEPIFDDEGNVVRVVYTYYDGIKELIDYTPSVPQPHTDSMETVAGSPPKDMMTLLADVAVLGIKDIERFDLSDHQGSVSPSRGDLGDVGHDDGLDVGGRRRWSRTSKKKCMKKCKTKRRRQLRRRRRCKTTQKNIVKSRRRRTCARRL